MEHMPSYVTSPVMPWLRIQAKLQELKLRGTSWTQSVVVLPLAWDGGGT